MNSMNFLPLDSPPLKKLNISTTRKKSITIGTSPLKRRGIIRPKIYHRGAFLRQTLKPYVRNRKTQIPISSKKNNEQNKLIRSASTGQISEIWQKI